MNKRKLPFKSILLVDDNKESLSLYSKLLMKKCKVEVTCAQNPDEAIDLANQFFFDIVLIDVGINFRNDQFAGIEIYKQLEERYGDSALIIYSQNVTDDFLKQYKFKFKLNFLEIRVNPDKFINEAIKMMTSLRKKQSCFVAMPFSPDYDGVFKVIKQAIKGAEFVCKRVDQQQFNKSIVNKIFDEIQRAKLIIFLASGKSPNAFYECGYAVALNKEVITLIDAFSNLPFDIKDRTAIEYGSDFSKLGLSLGKKLDLLTQTSVQ